MNAAVWSDYPASAAWLSEYIQVNVSISHPFLLILFRYSAERLGSI